MAVLKSLYLHNFRNFKESLVTFSPNRNVIIGNNGQGKTNLLEAIYFLITGRSFRTTNLLNLIHYDATYFKIEARFIKNDLEQRLQIYYSSQKRQLIYNHTSYSSLIHLLGILHGTVYTSFDNYLIKGSPATRRHFLNLMLSQTDPIYIHHLKRYERAMKQRNIMLRQQKIKGIQIFEHEMAKQASPIFKKRVQLICELEMLSTLYQKHVNSEPESLQLKYKTLQSLDTQSDYLQHFQYLCEKNRQKELKLGYTLSGPHKDDLEILINDKEAKLFASEGQKQCILIALRLAEWKQLEIKSGETPLMCVDDFGLGLDQIRLKHQYQTLEQLGQVFITMPKISSSIFQDDDLQTIVIDAGQISTLSSNSTGYSILP